MATLRCQNAPFEEIGILSLETTYSSFAQSDRGNY
jgi:hypothetical protein